MIYSKWVIGAMPPEAETIRREVFLQEQGFSAQSQFDAMDERSWHLLVEEGGQTVATGRLALDEKGCWKLGCIAVLPAFRGAHWRLCRAAFGGPGAFYASGSDLCHGSAARGELLPAHWLCAGGRTLRYRGAAASADGLPRGRFSERMLPWADRGSMIQL